MTSFTATVQSVIPGPPAVVFDRVMPIDLASIFPGYGPLPAVTGVRGQTGAWDGVGQSRTVLLSDGSSAGEQITAYDRPGYFAYTVNNFTGVLRLITNSATGRWWFEPDPTSDSTRVKWSYIFHGRSFLTAPILWFVTNILWRGYMRKSLGLAKSQIEPGAVHPRISADWS